MKDLTYAKCPRCPNEAKTGSHVNRLFGYRRYQDHTYVQSNCKKCRARIQRRRQRLGFETSWSSKN